MRLPGQREGGIGVRGEEGYPTEKPERVRDHAGIAVPAMNREAPLEHPSGQLEVAVGDRQRGDHRFRLRAHGR